MSNLGFGSGFLKHLIKTNTKFIIENSYHDVHARGVDSLMLYKSPDLGIRVFIAQEHHELYRNMPFSIKPFRGSELSVAVHRHRYPVTLIPIAGHIYNIEFFDADSYVPGHNKVIEVCLEEFQYKSALKGVGSFKSSLRYKNFLQGEQNFEMPLNVPVYMNMDQYHTIYVPEGQKAIWLVLEGREDEENYESLSYSNANLDAFKFSGMYEKMSEETVHMLLSSLQMVMV